MVDRAVKAVKRLPPPPGVKHIETQVLMRCRYCKFKTRRITRAWAHSMTHGPWPEELGGSLGHFKSLERPKPIRRTA